jgi:spermidine/putrescine transport system permease protein|tara:strand:- start:325 stop:1200 length:876 start_codon:yes stop_codon:yes gene_type:complete
MNKTKNLLFLLTPFTLYITVFFLGPILILLTYSFLEPGLYGGVVWNFYHHNYGRILGWADGIIEEFNPVYFKIFLSSFKLALITVIITLVICYPTALWISRLKPKLKVFFLFLVTLPFFSSLVVRLFAWMILLKPSGLINEFLLNIRLIDEPLQMLFTETAVLIGLVYILVPFMFLPLYASIEKIDNSLIQASNDLGGNRLITFFKITLPLSFPGILGGSILVFIPSLGNFIVPDLLGGAKVMMIGNIIEQSFLTSRNWPFGACLAIILMIVVVTLLYFYVKILSKYEKII